MPAELFDERGPEANNRRAAEFESQLEAMAHTLGWTYVCRNVDVVIKPAGRNPSRGVDLLCALENPQTGDKDGILSEAKVHGSQAALSELQKELQTLHDKMSDFSSRQAFLNNEDIRASVDALRWGLLAHRTSPWDRTSARRALRSVKLKSLHKAAHVTTIVFAGPDTLEALADCVSVRVDDAPLTPTEFYWPAHEDANGVWARCCPPHQLAEGMVAFKTAEGRTVLWIRDTLVVKDMNLIKDIVFQWRVDVDAVVFSELSRDAWALLRDPWRRLVTEVAKRQTGSLPAPDRVYPRNLTYAGVNAFDDAWPVAAEVR